MRAPRRGTARAPRGLKPVHRVAAGAIVASVGGGGLYCGLVTGLKRHGWDDVPVLTAETDGAACFAAALAAGGEPTRLEAITSVATSLGALQASPTALALARAHPTEAREAA